MNRIGDNLICTGSNEQIVRAFSTHGVQFILVGGLAVSWHCASRQADDMDLVVNPTTENSRKVSEALCSFGLTGFEHEAFARPGVQAQLKQIHYADILTPERGGLTFEELMSTSIVGKLFNIPVHIPSVANLIKLKENAATSAAGELNKHRQDVALLRSHAV